MFSVGALLVVVVEVDGKDQAVSSIALHAQRKLKHDRVLLSWQGNAANQHASIDYMHASLILGPAGDVEEADPLRQRQS